MFDEILQLWKELFGKFWWTILVFILLDLAFLVAVVWIVKFVWTRS